jgi:hypothetical protein
MSEIDRTDFDYWWAGNIDHNEHGEVQASVFIHNKGENPFEAKISKQCGENFWEIIDSDQFDDLGDVESFLGIDVEFEQLEEFI